MSIQDVGLKVVLLGVREFERNADKVDKSIKDTNKSLDSTGTSTRRASDSLSSYSDKADKAGRRTKNLGTETKTLGERFSSLGSKVTGLGVVLTAGLTVPLNALRTAMISTGIEFEDAFSDIGKTVDGVVDDFGAVTEVGEKFKKELIDISLRLPISANELANVAAAAGQIGIPFGENGKILLEFTEIVSKLAVATNLTAEGGAISIARFANIYGIEAEKMIEFTSGFANALVALGNTTAANEQEILNFATRLAPFTSLANISADATLALGASMAELGIRAEAGSTSLSTIILTLNNASTASKGTQKVFDESNKKMEEGLDKLGQLLRSGVRDLTELEFALQGTGLNLSGLSGYLDDLEGDFSSVNASIQKTQNTLNKYQRDLDGLERDQRDLRKELAAGVITQAQFDDAAASLADRYVDMQSSISSTNITMGEQRRRLQGLKDDVVSVDDVLQHVSMNTMMDLNAAMESATSDIKIFADILGVSEKEFQAAWGEDAIGTLVIFLRELSKLQEAGEISDETLTKLGFSGIRVQTVFQAVGSQTEGMVDNLDLAADAWVEQTALQAEVTKKFATTKNQIQLMKNAFNALSIAVFDFVKPSFDAMIKTMTELIIKFKDFFQASDENAKTISRLFAAASLLGPALIAVGIALRTIGFMLNKAAFGELFTPMISFATSPLVLIGLASIAAAFLLIKSNVFGIGDVVKRSFKGVGEVIDTTIKSFKLLGLDKVLSSVFGDVGSGDFGGAFDGIKLAWELVKISITRDILPEIADQFANIKDLAGPNIAQFKTWLGEQFASIPEVTLAITDFIKNTASVIASKLLDWGEAFIAWIIPYIPQITTKLYEFVTALYGWIKEQAPKILEQLKEWGNAFIEWINNIDSGKILYGLAYVAGLITGWATGLGIALIDSLPDISSQIGTWLGDNVSKTDIKNVLKTIQKIGTDVAKGFADGFKKGLESALKLVGKGDLFDSIAETFNEWIKGDGLRRIKESLSSALSSLGDAIGEIDWESVLSTIGEKFFYALGALVGSVVIAFAGLIVLLVNIIKDTDWESVWDSFNTIVEASLKGLVSGFKDVFLKAINELDIAEELANLLLGVVDFLNRDAENVLYDVGKFVLEGLWEGMKYVWNSILKPGISAIFNGFIDLVKGIFESSSPSKVFFRIGKDVLLGLWDGMKIMWETVKGWLSAVFNAAIENIKNILSALLQIGIDAIQFLWDGMKSLWESFKTWLTERVNSIVETFKSILAGILNVGKNIVVSIQGGIQEGWDAFVTWVGQKVSGIKTKFTDLVTDMLTVGADIVAGLKQGISDSWDAFTDWIVEKIGSIPVIGSIALEILSPSKAMARLGENVVLGLKVGMEDAFPDVYSMLKNAFNTMEMTTAMSGGSLSSAMVGAATGSTITNNSSVSSMSTSKTFAPTIQGVPMQDESAVGTELARSWRMAQVIGNI